MNSGCFDLIKYQARVKAEEDRRQVRTEEEYLLRPRDQDRGEEQKPRKIGNFPGTEGGKR